MLLSADRSALVVVDIQERLIPVVVDAAQVIDRSRILLQAAAALNIPVLSTEQYSKGLGPTVDAIAGLLGDSLRVEKITFSSVGEPAVMAALRAMGRDQIVLCGIEAHVCVLQTALALRQAGRNVYVVADAVSSRRPDSVALALDRMRAAGVTIVNTEMAVFEWLERAGTPVFKTLSALIK